MATPSEQEMIRMLYGLPAVGPASPVAPLQFDARRPGTTPMQSTMAGVPNVPAIPAQRVQEGSPPPAIGAALAFPQGGPTVNLPNPARAAAPAARAPAAPRAVAPKPTAASPNLQVLSTGPQGLPYGFQDPRSAIRQGLDMQLDYQRLALENASKAAASGDPRNASYRFAAAMGTLGTNNFGSVQQQGIEALNRALGDMQQTEMQTETARANALTSANAQLGSAGIGASAARYSDNLAMERFWNTMQRLGTESYQEMDPITKLPVTKSRDLVGTPIRGGGFRAYGSAPDGTRMVDRGQAFVRKNGQWVPEKK